MLSLLEQVLEKKIKESTVFEKIALLDKNLNDFINIDLNKEVIAELFENDVDSVFSTLYFVQTIMQFDKDENVIEQLDSNQKLLLKQFIIRAKEKANNNKYKIILDKLNRKEIITEIDFIVNLLNEEKISVDEINKILLNLLNYNKTSVVENHSENGFVKFNKSFISLDELNYLLARYNFNNVFDKNTVDIILSSCSYDEIEGMFSILSSPQFGFVRSDDKLFSTIIVNSSKETLINLINLSKNEKHGFNLSVLKNIVPAFVSKKSKRSGVPCGHENFVNLVNLFIANNINVAEMLEKRTHLFKTSSKLIERNIKAFKAYELGLLNGNSSINLSSASWMSAANLMDTCDQFIELDEYQYIKDNPSMLRTNDIFCFIRLLYAKKNNLQYYGTDRSGRRTMLPEIFKETINSRIYIPNDVESLNLNLVSDASMFQIDNILNNNNDINFDFNCDLISLLDEKYRISNLAYRIDNKTISRIKVIRNAAILAQHGIEIDKRILLHLVTHNSLLNEQEYNNIREAINSLKYERSF